MTIERRPGIDKIIAEVKAEHPRWNMPQIISVAKQRWHQANPKPANGSVPSQNAAEPSKGNHR